MCYLKLFIDPKEMRKLLTLIIFLLGSLLTNTSTFSLDHYRNLNHYVQDIWTTENGLPQNTITTIIQANDGYLWMGTFEGLVRFDGKQLKVYQSWDTPGLRGNFIETIVHGKGSMIWIGTNRGLTQYNKRKFKTYTKEDGLPNDQIWSLYLDRKNTLWIGTESGLGIFENNQFKVHTVGKIFENKNVMGICEEKNGSIWISAPTFLVHFEKGKKIQYIETEVFKNTFIRTMKIDDTDTLWIGTDHGLVKLKDGKFQWYTTKNGLTHNRVSHIEKDRDGNLWIATFGGLNRKKDHGFETFDLNNSLSHNLIRSVYEDREGILWVGSANGLNALKNSLFTTISTENGLSDNIIWSIYEDRQGVMWIGTHRGGLNRSMNTLSNTFEPENGLSGRRVNSILEDSMGDLWVGTDFGLYRKNQGKLLIYTRENGLINDQVTAVFEDSRKKLWIGTIDGLCRFENETFKPYTVKQGAPDNFITTIMEDNKGILWFGTKNGLYRYSNNEFIDFTVEKGQLSSNYIRDIYEDKKGIIWIGTYGGGLIRFNGSHSITYSKKTGLFDNVVSRILTDESENFWMSCNKGIFMVTKKELDDYAAGKCSSISSISFGKEAGMKNPECNGGVHSAGWKTRDKKLWFPTIEGAVVVDPENMQINTLPPPVVIEKVLVDNIEVDNVDSLVVPAESKWFEIHFTALSFMDPNKIEFKYKLDNYEKTWVKMSENRDRIVKYTNIPPGKYNFTVIACNNDGFWNETGASSVIIIKPHFWRTSWFSILSGILFMVFSYFLVHFIRRQIALIAFWKKKKRIGVYELVEIIGSGGMGIVYKGYKIKEKKDICAIKVLREEFSNLPVYRKRFEREAQLTDLIRHPNIVEIYDRGFGRNNENLYIAMEYLTGESLSQLIEQGKLTINIILEIMKQILSALVLVHEKKIIHRDMKPENIRIIKKEGNPYHVKILDFGLARLDIMSRLTRTRTVLGTMAYVSPEQIKGEEVASPSDIFSTGIILYEMITGKNPFMDDNESAIMQNILNKEPNPPKAVVKSLAEEMNSLVMSLLNKDPDNRPTAKEILKILNRMEE